MKSKHNQILNFKPKAHTQSSITAWWFEEKRKQELGLKNDHDIELIKSALKGYINPWSERVKANPKKFEIILTGKPWKWEDIIS